MRFPTLAAALSFCTLTACAVGPNFQTPDAPVVTSYEASPLPDKTQGADTENGHAQQFAMGQTIPDAWWTLFHSEPLERMITQAIRHNPDLAAAQASLRAADEDVAAAEGYLFPTATLNFSTTRQKTTPVTSGIQGFPGSVYTLNNASVNVTYGLDVWGGTRRAIEELEAEKDFQRYQLEATYLTLTSNVVTAAVQEASVRGQIDATQKIIEEETHQWNVLKQQLDAGAIAKTAVLAQEATLAQTRATLPALEKQLAVLRHELSVLMGQFPSQEPAAIFELKSLTLPEQLPVSLPSSLVAQRPDIQEAEANLHAASAAIGVAEANRLPQISLSADIGTAASAIGNMLNPIGEFWSMGFGAAQTVFDAGTLEHKQLSAEAQYDVAAAQYRKTVLAAFQDVADTLRALQADADALAAQVTAERAASDSLMLAKEQYKAGSISYLSFLTAEQTEQQARVALVQAEGQRFADTAALFQALGGGWWNRKLDITKPEMPDKETDVAPSYTPPSVQAPVLTPPPGAGGEADAPASTPDASRPAPSDAAPDAAPEAVVPLDGQDTSSHSVQIWRLSHD